MAFRGVSWFSRSVWAQESGDDKAKFCKPLRGTSNQIEGVIPNQTFQFSLWRLDEFRYPAVAFDYHFISAISSELHREYKSSNRSIRFQSSQPCNTPFCPTDY